MNFLPCQNKDLNLNLNLNLPLPVSRDLRDIFLFKFHVNIKDGNRLRCKQFNIINFFFLFVHKLTVNQLFCIEYEIKQH